MNTIKFLSEIRNANGPVYVRWSKSITLDNKRGYSRRYGTMREVGLSACEIGKDWDDDRILRQLAEYEFCGGSCWIVTGEQVGRGGDNEPLITNVELIGKVSKPLLKAAKIALLEYFISIPSTYQSQRERFEQDIAALLA